MGCKIERIVNPFGFVGARLANGVLKNDTDIGSCSLFPDDSSAPFDLSSMPMSSSEIDLVWDDNNTNSPIFSVERGLDGLSFSQIATTSNLFYNDSGLSDEGHSITIESGLYYLVLAYTVI